MDDALLDLILRRLDEYELAENATALLLAACDGEKSLVRQLGGESTTRPKPTASSTDTAEPAGAYLRSITVTAFRGVGPACTLPIEPGPGLTLVVGRNGSGKSSFAEGLEVLLTGGLRRWEERSAIWKDSWRNLHCADSPSIEAELILEDGGPTTARRAWGADADINESVATMQVKSQKQRPLSELGWSEELTAYRPFLSHSELEAFFGRPSDLYELLSSVLGLEDLTATATRLAEARKNREGALAQAKKSLAPLLGRVDSVDDERAAKCSAALSGRKWDLDAVEAIVTGTSETTGGGEMEWLRRAGQLTGPDTAQAAQVSTSLRGAADILDDSAGSESGLARELADLLDAAVSHIGHVDTTDCPICGTEEVLDSAWRGQAQQRVTQLRQKAKAADDAVQAAVLARRAAASLLAGPPAFLRNGAPDGIDVVPLLEAWSTWLDAPDSEGAAGLRSLADHLDAHAANLATAVNGLASGAAQAVREREDRWAPIATDLAAWCAAARAALGATDVVPALKAAEKWLKEANDDIRNSRLAPIAEEARAIWAQLRQESNVDLGNIRLTGSGPKRQLQIDVTVDGSEGAALGVMSQGEVNALALSIFLPRATLPESPFRFLSIDDPVQAMDPAKVDGFARVLQEVSARRQVIVFTHDDRLHEAIRRLKIQATALEVTRQAESVVEVRQVDDPADRAISDALAVCADDSVPQKVAARVVPGLCRIAAESAFVTAARRKLLSEGRRHAEVEAELERAPKLNDKAALAMHGDAARGGDVLKVLNKWDRRVADTFQALKSGGHNEHPGELRDLVSDTRLLVHEVRTNLA
ncbi:MAG TPA: AAA family ATPase [Acidimicrobiales bacterium]|nr:AAA family ATPase [Acidimicrobiales bacterium]